jgi:hypothetical protein
MSNEKPHTHHSEHPSALDSFSLSFEYDMSWADARKSIKRRAA